MCETMGSSDILKMFNDKVSDEDRNFIAKFFGRIAEGIRKHFNSKDEFPNKFSDIVEMFEGAVKNKGVEVAKASGTETRNALSKQVTGNMPTYTDQEYRDFGWARENDIITAGENENYRSKFAMLKKV